ncbi:MAG: hypothetical protein CSA20_05565 [Deltaproteobacteria bacterium]|nr:MAG: hypothetical protein CSB23_03465 [Deltaproteobacteria bacterium]PIE72935.1 MAG: hypothetical protein CSA20_05565 [Deltaproteobacteria bacterium]
MEKNLVANNPVRALGPEEKEKGAMGLVMARAGLGKTAVLVQLALDYMLLGNKVLHVSIGEGLEKTRTWYDDILSLFTDGEKIGNIPAVMKNRMIMTFKESSFSTSLFKERLDDLVAQDIYKPQCLIVDGYDFTGSSRESLEDFKRIMQEQDLRMIWFSAISHRDDTRTSKAGVPAPCHEVDDLFDAILLIRPEGEAIHLDILRCDFCATDPDAGLALDPSTMLIKKI